MGIQMTSRPSTAAPILAAVAVVLPVLYVLSIGPATRLNGYDWPAWQAFTGWFYCPITILRDRFDWINDAVLWYTKQW
jgi:hypothetical protein